MKAIVAAALVALTACAGEDMEPADKFMKDISAHCGRSYQGRVVSNDAVDSELAQETLTMQVRRCSKSILHVPFHVGDDHSRIWVITRTKDGLRLKHDHRHKDGSVDAVTQYGGDSAAINEGRIEFPADQYSIELFQREGLSASMSNVWAMEITEDLFVYELSRENRFFRVEFDLTTPVAAPPPPWGAGGL